VRRGLTLPCTASGQTVPFQILQRPNVAAMRWRDGLAVNAFVDHPYCASSCPVLLQTYPFNYACQPLSGNDPGQLKPCRLEERSKLSLCPFAPTGEHEHVDVAADDVWLFGD
jgi:hypothetical protein